MNLFSKFSYYEFNHNDLYFGAFPSRKTSPPIKLLKPGYVIFDSKFIKNQNLINEFNHFCKMISVNESHGFFDFIGYLLPRKVINNRLSYEIDESMIKLESENIVTFLLSLFIKSVSLENYHQKIIIGSKIISNYEMTLFVRNVSAKQEACDVSTVIIENIKTNDLDEIKNKLNSKEIKPILLFNKKKKSDLINISFKKSNISMLKKGAYGFSPHAGEHVEIDESERAESMNKVSNLPYKLAKKNDLKKMLERALVEELGLTLDNVNHTIYYVGYNDNDRRDKRYCKVVYENVNYGYDRKSISYIYAIIIKSNKPLKLKKHTDLEEIENVSAEELFKFRNEFRREGMYKPAFPIHIEQLENNIIKYLPEMIHLFD